LAIGGLRAVVSDQESFWRLGELATENMVQAAGLPASSKDRKIARIAYCKPCTCRCVVYSNPAGCGALTSKPYRNLPLSSGGGALLAKPQVSSFGAKAHGTASVVRAKGAIKGATKGAIKGTTKGAITGAISAAACSGGAQAAKPASIQVTAGTAEVILNSKSKTKKIGAPLGVWVDILLANAVPGAAADPACRIKVPGAIKAGATRTRKIPVTKLTACYTALKLADCSAPLQARATAVAGKKYKEGPASKAVTFTPSCKPC
jgi:hypothetical protein